MCWIRLRTRAGSSLCRAQLAETTRMTQSPESVLLRARISARTARLPHSPFMNTRITLPIVLVLVTLGFTYGLLQGGVVPQGPTLPIFATGDQAGEVASCGCPKEDYGGTTRKAAFFDTLRTSGWEFVLVDAGDLTPFHALDAQDRLKAET